MIQQFVARMQTRSEDPKDLAIVLNATKQRVMALRGGTVTAGSGRVTQ